jgi:hypothetical protein
VRAVWKSARTDGEVVIDRGRVQIRQPGQA